MINQNTLLGRFFFKETDNGNLIGELSNYPGPEISTESADWIKGCDDKCANCRYHGTYHSTWLDDDGPQYAELKIFKNKKTGANKLFTLEWRDKNGKLIYEGEGMLCDGILIGDYHDMK
jgi:hypothetical protein